MQPRRDTQHTPYGETQNPAEDRLEEEAYQPVKPVGYEARLALSLIHISGHFKVSMVGCVTGLFPAMP